LETTKASFRFGDQRLPEETYVDAVGARTITHAAAAVCTMDTVGGECKAAIR